MQKLSEELLDIIIANTPRPLLNHWTSGYANLLSLSLVSRIFHRITEPYLYQAVYLPDVVVPGENGVSTFQNTIAQARLCRYVRTVHLLHDDNTKNATVEWLSKFPNLQTLEINMRNSPLVALVPFLRVRSFTKLCLLAVQFQENEDDGDNWEVENSTITSLSISLVEPADPWEDCTDIDWLARVFTNVQRLDVQSTDELVNWCPLNGPVFRCLAHAFQASFQTTLREFTYRYNDPSHGETHYGHEEISNNYDARAIMKQSQLEHLVTEVNCLFRPLPLHHRCYMLPGFSLPISLRTLYLRYHIPYDRVARDRENMIYSEEAQLLAQTVKMLRQQHQLPNMVMVTLAVFLPTVFERVASMVVRRHGRHGRHGRQAETPLNIIIVYVHAMNSQILN